MMTQLSFKGTHYETHYGSHLRFYLVVSRIFRSSIDITCKLFFFDNRISDIVYVNPSATKNERQSELKNKRNMFIGLTARLKEFHLETLKRNK